MAVTGCFRPFRSINSAIPRMSRSWDGWQNSTCLPFGFRDIASPVQCRLSTKGSSKMPSVLFSPITLRGLTLPNRVVVSPMCQYNSDNGSAHDWHLMHLGSFSLGCAGLVMCEMTNVNPRGRISPKCAGMWSDENEAALKRVHDFCRTYGVAKLGVQVAHV